MLLELATLRGFAKVGGAVVWLLALGWAFKRLAGFFRRRDAAAFLYIGLYLLFLVPGYFLLFLVAAGAFPTVWRNGLPNLGYAQFLLMLASLMAPCALALAFTRKKWLTVLAGAATAFGLVWVLWLAFAAPEASVADEGSPWRAGEILELALLGLAAFLHLLTIVLGMGIIKTSSLYDEKETKESGWRGLFRYIKENRFGTQGEEEISGAASLAAEKIEDVRTQASKAAKQQAEQVSEAVGDAAESLRKASERAGEAAKRGVRKMSEVAGDATEKLGETREQVGSAAEQGLRKVSGAAGSVAEKAEDVLEAAGAAKEEWTRRTKQIVGQARVGGERVGKAAQAGKGRVSGAWNKLRDSFPSERGK